jgi:hypothetical protein
MKKFYWIFVLFFLLPAMASATVPTTPNLGLYLPPAHQENWAAMANSNWSAIDAAIVGYVTNPLVADLAAGGKNITGAGKIMGSTLVAKGPAAITSFSGRVSSTTGSVNTLGTVTFSQASDAIKAGYSATNPIIGAQVTAGGVTVTIVGWTSSTVATIGCSPEYYSPYSNWSGTAITSVQLPISSEAKSDGTLARVTLADGSTRVYGGSRGDGTLYESMTYAANPAFGTNGVLVINGAIGDPVGLGNTFGIYDYMLAVRPDSSNAIAVVNKSGDQTGYAFADFDGSGTQMSKINSNGSAEILAPLTIGPRTSTQYARGLTAAGGTAQTWSIESTGEAKFPSLTIGTAKQLVISSGSPEGVTNYEAGPGSSCRDETNGDIYNKTTGTGNTGWVLESDRVRKIATLSDLISYKDSSAQVTVVAPITMTSVQTITAPLKILPGCPITTTGYPPNINGTLEPGDHQMFIGPVAFGDKVSSVNPLWFGENTTPLTTDMSAAFSYAVATGKEVHIPNGSYKISTSALLVATEGQHIHGSGYNTTILQETGNVPVIDITAAKVELDHITLGYLVTPTAGGIGIAVNGAFSSLHDFHITSSFDGVKFNYGVSQMHDFYIDNYVNTGLFANGAVNDIYIKDFIINAGDSINGALGGIRLYNQVEAFIAEDGELLNGVYPFTSGADTYAVGSRPAYNRFTSVYFDSAKYAAYIDNIVSTEFNTCWFSGGRSGVGYAGALVGNTHSDLISFPNSTFANCGGAGAIVAAGAKRTSFHNSHFQSNSVTSGSGVHDGLEFMAGATDWQVIGGDGGNDLFPSGLQGYSISIAAGASDRYLISGFNFGSTGIDGKTLLDLGTGTDAKVINNIGYNPVGASTITVTASPFTYQAGHSPETIYIYGGTVSDVSTMGTTVATATGCSVNLSPNESIIVTYSGAPTMKRSIH